MRDEGKFVAGQPIHNRTRDYRSNTQYAVQAKKQLIDARWLLKFTLGMLVLFVTCWGWQKINNPQTLPINTIQITGLYEHADRNALRQLILPYVEKGFLWADTSALQDRLQQFPWIYSADVKRQWPNKLVINLTEQKPVARMNDDMLVNAQGDRFAVEQTTIPAGLPLFITPFNDQQQLILTTYKTLSAILAPLAVKIAAIALDARQSWSVQLDNGMVIIIGKVEPAQRLQRLVQVYSRVVGANAASISSIDLRYASGVSVRFKNQVKA